LEVVPLVGVDAAEIDRVIERVMGPVLVGVSGVDAAESERVIGPVLVGVVTIGSGRPE